ncbi:unnamed protein product [Paramecium sonneborni]|uniref:Transmembrane protein n=1 Tax=Paramecium sonneborni TaxID=65129 RepID=A0A8S1N074_9CILI|nr:unnamed protein product [Paramecium sonneborni]
MKAAIECFNDFLFLECYLQYQKTYQLIQSLELRNYMFNLPRNCYLLHFEKTMQNIKQQLFQNINTNYVFAYFTYYFLEELFFQFYQGCLIFYFGKKLVAASSQRKNLNIIRLIFIILIILDIITFILSIVEANSKEKMCKQISFTVFRSVSLFTQIIFLFVVQKLHKKFQQNLQSLLIDEQQTKRQKLHLFQLKILCYISLIGSIILLIVNFLYMISDDCRIIGHFGDEGENFSDALNALVHAIVKLLTYFVPIIITLAIFQTKSKKELHDNSQLEAEDLSGQSYFKGLTIIK